MKIEAEQRIASAIKSSVSLSTRYTKKAGDELYRYSEKEERLIPGLCTVSIDKKNVWTIIGSRVAKLNHSRVLPELTEEMNYEIMILLKSLHIFRTGGSEGVMIT